MILNEMGLIAYNEWLKTPELRPNVSLDVFVIMPNHMHGIIIITETGRGELHSPRIDDIANPNELHSPRIDDIANPDELHSPRIDDIANPNELHSPRIDDFANGGECDSPRIDDFANGGECDSPRIDDFANGGECDSPLPLSTPFRSPSKNVGAIVRGYKSSVTKQINLLNYDGTVWQRNYHDHIIKNEPSYHRIAGYIVDNPKNWIGDKFHIK